MGLHENLSLTSHTQRDLTVAMIVTITIVVTATLLGTINRINYKAGTYLSGAEGIFEVVVGVVEVGRLAAIAQQRLHHPERRMDNAGRVGQGTTTPVSVQRRIRLMSTRPPWGQKNRRPA